MQELPAAHESRLRPEFACARRADDIAVTDLAVLLEKEHQFVRHGHGAHGGIRLDGAHVASDEVDIPFHAEAARGKVDVRPAKP